VPYFTKLKEMLDKVECDVLAVCTPSGIHPQNGILAAEHGVHVLTEKPMATKLKEADDLIQACDRHHVQLFVVKQNRLNTTMQLLKNAIDKGRFGKIYQASVNVFWQRPQEYYDMAKWRGTWEFDGGAYMNQASHYVDALEWLIGEPESVMAMTSTAEDKNDHWCLNGSKTWISNAGVADVIIYYAYTDPEKGSKGLSAFVIEPKNFNGIKTSTLEKMGSHSSPSGEIFLTNTKVPKENIIGKPGDGARILFGSLNQTRLSAAAGAVGVAQACLEISLKYCNERKQFGKPIGEFQMNQDMIAQMSTEIEAARLLVYKAAWEKDQGNLNNGLDVAQAKYFAGEVVTRCAGYAMRILGAYGYSTEYPVARFYRDTPTYTMVEGSANICKWIIALDQLGIKKANR
jgi:hypothetical protein